MRAQRISGLVGVGIQGVDTAEQQTVGLIKGTVAEQLECRLNTFVQQLLQLVVEVPAQLAGVVVEQLGFDRAPGDIHRLSQTGDAVGMQR
ncbi:hypothetical protein SDC9_162194 [bioreactor metagenome]|uniref:Uncharacterized protein n=1 Tax=bioreactor metagenome TaxID=1076179 RepID=A0A645FKE7_9ZZZZ